ncbi:DNA methylase family (plasmid) [Cupriavidus necator N-1]|uniref:DNA methylase family n=1 Tax=Cupriavidus necator (strain ATCC 43291 / DSM 13513 / CCUG 52238 / LMG 8453 / N-1) TaxID=1042878 RepID=F8GYP0_CUPNN|nr:N-6 DNA methylase [Cupriavidus necator]AEI82981.1 DNA methylase family [Cupriavidus necator N-1]MDX6008767.1 N-6 DNA methylase [Cupriavidus necator]
MLSPERATIGARRSDELGRYYTRADIGELLVDYMGSTAPYGVLDLGSGVGSLSEAAARRWSNSNILTVDVDQAVSAQIRAALNLRAEGRHAHLRADALSSRLPLLIRAQLDKIDAAVCNPPFIKPVWRKTFDNILEDAGLSGCLPAIKDADAALLFLAQNLRTLDAGATLGIILPDTMISSQRYQRFRKDLLARYKVEAVIKLPRGSFLGTEALASILIVKTAKPTDQSVPLYKLNFERTISTPILVPIDQAVERLDYDYHALTRVQPVRPGKKLPLAAICTEVRRGLIENSLAKRCSISVFHTTSMSSADLGRWVDLPNQFPGSDNESSMITATSGDILVARVGRNIGQKILGVATGMVLLTDCVYRIRVPQRYQKLVLSQLSSKANRDWFESRTYGVGARQLTKADLLSFPIYL